MEDLRSKIILPEDSFSDEELEALLKADRTTQARLLARLGQRLHPVEALTNPFVGSFDVSQAEVAYTKKFFPTAIARRSYLHLQSLSKVSFGPNHFTTRGNVQSFLITQTTLGGGRLGYQDKSYELGPDNVFFIDCRQPHHYHATSPEGWGYRVAHLDGYSLPDFFGQVLAGGGVRFSFEEDSLFTELFESLYETNRQSAPDCEFLTHCTLTQMLTELMKTLPQFDVEAIPPQIKRMADWLTQHCSERLSLDEIAQQFSLSKYYLSREFKRYMGKTLFEFLAEARMNTAKELLRYTDLPVAVITEYAGFEDQSNFGRLFRRLEGLTPSAYRRQWRGV